MVSGIVSGFERLLFGLYTDQQLREAVRNDPLTYGQRYGLSEQEIEALTHMDWGAFRADTWGPIEDPCRCSRCACYH